MNQTPTSITIAVLQMRCVSHRDDNVNRAIDHIRSAASQGAQVICLQELFTDLYPCQREDHQQFACSETIPGPTTQALSAVAAEQRVVIIAGLFEKRAAGIYHNSAAVIDADGSLCGVYRKMHIPDDPLYYEKFYFTPGDLGFRCFETHYGRIGVCICWDQWFPEAARLTALAGANILFYPTAIGWLEEDKEEHGEDQVAAWQTMMRSHAIANGLFVAAANRVGTEADLEFWGSSFVCNPYGKLLATASREEENVLVTQCDLSEIESARTHWPFLRDRRIDAYHGLTQRYLDHE